MIIAWLNTLKYTESKIPNKTTAIMCFEGIVHSLNDSHTDHCYKQLKIPWYYMSANTEHEMMKWLKHTNISQWTHWNSLVFTFSDIRMTSVTTYIDSWKDISSFAQQH